MKPSDSEKVMLLPECLKAIDGAEVVSFDVFDTLLIRRIALPHHLFWLMEPKAREMLHDPMLDFYTYRRRAERLARDTAYRDKREEVSLEEIYDTFFRLLPVLDPTKKAALIELEIETEYQHCFASPIAHPMFEYARAKGKTVVMTTDMYLSEKVIRKLLSDNGFEGYDHLLLSSVTGKTKHQGSAFKLLKETVKKRGRKILHVGDNVHADIRQAKKHGLATYHIPRPLENFFALPYVQDVWGSPAEIDTVEKSMILATLINKTIFYRAESEKHFNPVTRDWWHFGYYIVGPLYLGFTVWLIQEARARNIEQLLFLARDGKIMKEVYDALAVIYGCDIDAAYLLVSRRALHIPRLHKGLDTAGLNYLTITDLTNPLPVRDYLTRNDLGLNPESYQEKLRQFGFSSLDAKVDSEAKVEQIKRFFASIAPEIVKVAEEEYGKLKRHLREQNVHPETKKRRAIVDVGWHASMQFALNDLLENKDNKLQGFFLGTMQEVDKIHRLGLANRSYLIDGARPFERYDVLKSCIEIVELLFTAPHGSVLKLEEKQGKMAAVMDHTENAPERLRAVKKLQEGAMQFIDDIAPTLAICPVPLIPADTAMKPLEVLLTDPTAEESTIFDGMTHIQNIGKSDLARAFVPRPNYRWLVLRPFRFGQQYKSAYWRKGFEVRMGRMAYYYFTALTRTYIGIRKRLRGA